ncbi:hypothetical protein [Streptomyces marokkonensis]|uniref:hypothetical protein n=1 Tax=Streptomyces marokkonensis TaxID=324855 RepID=UPI0031E90B0F
MAAHVRVGVGDPVRDPLGVAPRGRGDDGELKPVGTVPFELVQYGPQYGRLPGAQRQFTHPLWVGERIEGVQPALGLILGGGSRRARILPAGAGTAQQIDGTDGTGGTT